MASLNTLRAVLLGVVLAAAGAIPAGAQGEKTILVGSNGWHSGIVIARTDLPPGRIPETADFPAAAYFEFGWGNREYYPAPKKTLGMTIGAALPGAAVVHLSGMPRHPREMFPASEWVTLRLTSQGFERLLAFLDQSFERRGAARIAASAKGLYAFSAFYPATGTFHLFYTCNTWTADGLARAGLPVRTSGVQQAHELMSQLRALARGKAGAQPM